MRSIEARIRHAQDEAEQRTNAFILARNDMLRANIEKKMTEQEILLKDLYASKAQIELERGQKQTKEKIIDFIVDMLKGDPTDKGYQKLLIDNLVYKVFVYDDHIITYLTFGNDKEIKEISLADNDKAFSAIKVQPLSSMVHQRRDPTNFTISDRFLSDICFDGVVYFSKQYCVLLCTLYTGRLFVLNAFRAI